MDLDPDDGLPALEDRRRGGRAGVDAGAVGSGSSGRQALDQEGQPVGRHDKPAEGHGGPPRERPDSHPRQAGRVASMARRVGSPSSWTIGPIASRATT